MAKAVIFDLGGVMVPLDFPRAYSAIGKRCRYPAEEIRSRIASTDLVRRFECGAMESDDAMESDEFHRALSGLLEMDVTYGEFCKIWSGLFPPTH
jgi:hypothetical protein